MKIARKDNEGSASKLAKFAKSKSTPAISSSNSWMIRGSGMRAAVETAKVQASRKFAPEVFLKDGETKQLRFRSDQPLCVIHQYSFKRGGKWLKFTAPGPGEVDLFQENGLRPSLKAIYEVIDVYGYVTKDKKRVRNVPRFFVANVRAHETLETILRKKGSLTAFNIEIERHGEGTKTTYTFMPEEKARFEGLDKIPTLRGKLSEFYAPPTLAEQKAMFSNYDPASQERD